MGYGLHDPGCCCDPSCLIAEDLFAAALGGNWSTPPSGWSATGGVLAATTVDRLIFQPYAANQDDPIYLSVRLKATSGAPAVSRVLVGYRNADNYVFVEITAAALGCPTIRLGQRLAGVETWLQAAYPLVAGSGWSEWITVLICFVPQSSLSGTIRVRVAPQTLGDWFDLATPKANYVLGVQLETENGQPLETEDGQPLEPEENASGFLKTGLAVVAGDWQFDDYRLSYHYRAPDHAQCPQCSDTCQIHDDDFDRDAGDSLGCLWLEDAGDADISTDGTTWFGWPATRYKQISTGRSIVQRDQTQTTPDTQVVNVLATTPTAAAKAGVVFGWKSATDYYTYQVWFDAGANRYRSELRHVTTLLASSSHEPGTSETLFPGYGPDAYMTIRVCVTAGRVTASAFGNDYGSMSGSQLHFSSYTGLVHQLSGSVTGRAGIAADAGVLVRRFWWSQGTPFPPGSGGLPIVFAEPCSDCRPFVPDCGGCSEAETSPPYFLCTLAGVAAGTVPSFPDCTAYSCSAANVTYVARRKTTDFLENPETGCCRWDGVTDAPAAGPVNPYPLTVLGVGTYTCVESQILNLGWNSIICLDGQWRQQTTSRFGRNARYLGVYDVWLSSTKISARLGVWPVSLLAFRVFPPPSGSYLCQGEEMTISTDIGSINAPWRFGIGTLNAAPEFVVYFEANRPAGVSCQSLDVTLAYTATKPACPPGTISNDAAIGAVGCLFTGATLRVRASL